MTISKSETTQTTLSSKPEKSQIDKPGTFYSPDNDVMNEAVFLAYLREHKPYLFDIESAVIQISQETGYGEIVFNLRIINGLVEKGTASFTLDKVYIRRKNNQL